MNNQPLVSILMTAYNREKYIKDAIESVISSTYQNWELIISDDGSTDTSLNISKQFQKIDHRIKIFVNDKNLGDYPNRNKAASYATGKYLKYLDADDMLYPHSLEIMVAAMEKYPEAGLGITEYVNEDIDPYPFLLSPYQTYYREFLNHGILGVGPTATIIRRDVFEKLGGYSGKRYVSDVELWLKIVKYHPLVKIQSGLIYWRRHPGQEFDLGHFNNAYLVMNYQMHINALKDKDCPLSKEEIEYAIRKINHRQGRSILNLAIKKRELKKAWSVIHESGYSLINLFKSVI